MTDHAAAGKAKAPQFWWAIIDRTGQNAPEMCSTRWIARECIGDARRDMGDGDWYIERVCIYVERGRSNR